MASYFSSMNIIDWIELIGYVLLALLFMGALTNWLFSVPQLQPLKEWIQARFENLSTSMQVVDNAITYKVEYSYEKSRIPFLYLIFGTMPIRCENYYEVLARLKTPPPRVNEIDIRNGWSFENNLFKQLRSHEIPVGAHKKYVMEYIVPITDRRIYSLERIPLERIGVVGGAANEFIEEYEINLSNECREANPVILNNVQIPWDPGSEDILRVDVVHNNINLAFTATITRSQTLLLQNPSERGAGFTGQSTFLNSHPQFQFFLDQLSINPRNPTRIMIRKQRI